MAMAFVKYYKRNMIYFPAAGLTAGPAGLATGSLIPIFFFTNGKRSSAGGLTKRLPASRT